MGSDEKERMLRIPTHHKGAMDGAPGLVVTGETMREAGDYERDDMPAEIDFSGGERGRYAKRFAEGISLSTIPPTRP